MNTIETTKKVVRQWLEMRVTLNEKDATMLLREMVGIALQETYCKGWNDHKDSTDSSTGGP